MGWSRERLELNRRKLHEIDVRFFEAKEQWEALRDVLVPAIRRTQEGKAPADEDSSKMYLGLREWWLGQWHGFCEDFKALYLSSEDVYYAGVTAIERCYFYPTLRQAAESIISYGGHEKIYEATFIPAEDLFTRIEGRVRDLNRQLPTRRREVLNRMAEWAGAVPAGIESHPRTLQAVGLLVLAVVAWQFPSILREMAEFVRAIRGG